MSPTCDSLWGGALRFWQPARGHGYRFNLDPLLLADFVRPAGVVIDLGAGVGVLGIVLLASKKVERIVAVEVQPDLAALCERNAAENGFADRLTVLSGDARHLGLPEADAVVSNPPYFKADGGHAAPVLGRDIARRERHGTLAELVSTSRLALGSRGTWTGIVPQQRGKELQQLLDGGALRRRHIVPREGGAPGHVMIEARFGEPPGLQTEPPLVVHAAAGREFSPEVKRILRET